MPNSQHHTKWYKVESFFSKIKDKTRMPTFATFILHCIEILSMVITQEIKKKEDIQNSN